jgi:cell division protease FtsH
MKQALARAGEQEGHRHGGIEEARDKVRWGRERRSLAMSDEERRHRLARSRHALVSVLLKHTHPLHKVTIIPRGQALGSTMSLPKQDIYNRRRKRCWT